VTAPVQHLPEAASLHQLVRQVHVPAHGAEAVSLTMLRCRPDARSRSTRRRSPKKRPASSSDGTSSQRPWPRRRRRATAPTVQALSLVSDVLDSLGLAVPVPVVALRRAACWTRVGAPRARSRRLQCALRAAAAPNHAQHHRTPRLSYRNRCGQGQGRRQ
jgi:hypothetical protein